jgi:hypothetical protein
MEIYASAPGLRTRQVVADLGMLLWVWLFWRLGRVVHDLIAALAAPGRAVERAGRSLSDGAMASGGVADDVPLIGEALRRPFDAVAEGGRSLVEAGVAQQETTATLALVLGLVIGGLPILWLGVRWASWRWRWYTEASAVRHLLGEPGGVALLAHRALGQRTLRQLRAVEPDPWGAFATGRHELLAQAELDAVGLRLPERPPA